MDKHLQPILKNDLVTVRPLKADDFDALYKVANDPLLWEQHQNPDRWQKDVFVEFFNTAIDSKGAFVIIDNETQKIIGSSRYKLSNNSKTAIEIGWTFLSREYWGGLYNKSFKALMIAHAFNYFEHILFHVDKNNHRSQKAVQKLGGKLIDKDGTLAHLHTEVTDGLTFILLKTNSNNN